MDIHKDIQENPKESGLESIFDPFPEDIKELLVGAYNLFCMDAESDGQKYNQVVRVIQNPKRIINLLNANGAGASRVVENQQISQQVDEDVDDFRVAENQQSSRQMDGDNAGVSRVAENQQSSQPIDENVDDLRVAENQQSSRQMDGDNAGDPFPEDIKELLVGAYNLFCMDAESDGQKYNQVVRVMQNPKRIINLLKANDAGASRVVENQQISQVDEDVDDFRVAENQQSSRQMDGDNAGVSRVAENQQSSQPIDENVDDLRVAENQQSSRQMDGDNAGASRVGENLQSSQQVHEDVDDFRVAENQKSSQQMDGDNAGASRVAENLQSSQQVDEDVDDFRVAENQQSSRQMDGDNAGASRVAENLQSSQQMDGDNAGASRVAENLQSSQHIDENDDDFRVAENQQSSQQIDVHDDDSRVVSSQPVDDDSGVVENQQSSYDDDDDDSEAAQNEPGILQQFERALQDGFSPMPPRLYGIIGRAHTIEPFEKQLTNTDLDYNQTRLLINKPFVERVFLPMLLPGEDIKEGIPAKLYDWEGNKFNMKFQVWSGAKRTYVLTQGWKEFNLTHHLEAINDTIKLWMFRHVRDDRLCFAIIYKRIPGLKEEKEREESSKKRKRSKKYNKKGSSKRNRTEV